MCHNSPYQFHFWPFRSHSGLFHEHLCAGSLFISLSLGRRQWHPTPELLPGKSHGRRSLQSMGWAAAHGVKKSRTWLSDFTFTFHFHALEKEMVTHSSVLAWRIPGTVEPGGLPSMGSHRVGHDWSDLAANISKKKQKEKSRFLLRFPSPGNKKPKWFLRHSLFPQVFMGMNSPVAQEPTEPTTTSMTLVPRSGDYMSEYIVTWGTFI